MNGTIKKKKSVVENVYGQYTLGTYGGILIMTGPCYCFHC